MPDATAGDTARLLPRLCRAVKSATRAEGLNVLVNVGPVAGQSVEHVHWHIIPRHGGDSIAWPWRAGRYEEGQIEPLRAAISRALESDAGD
jgi:histidine triad (HIT) family protein